MARLIYALNQSLDGYVDHRALAPDAELFRHFIDDVRGLAGALYGRRMYEVMAVWDEPGNFSDESPITQDFAQIWRAAEKIVYSTTLERVSTAKTRLERTFDPAAIRALKDRAERDISIGGPTLAAEALRAGLVDECQLFLTPISVGGGTPSLPDNVRVTFELLDERRFASGVVYLRYRTVT